MEDSNTPPTLGTLGSQGRKQHTTMMIPISQELIQHVKRVDSFNEEEIVKLKGLLYSLVDKAALNKNENEEQFLQFTLKLHQILALLDIDLGKAMNEPEEALQELIVLLGKNGGLDYLPRERTPQGRLFEHASDCRILLKHLQQVSEASQTKQPTDNEVKQGPKTQSSIKVTSEVFYVKLIESFSESLQAPGTQLDGDSSSVDESMTLITLDKSYIDLTLTANGKADLYFHAYFWYTFALVLYQRFASSKGETLDASAANIDSFDQKYSKQSIELQRLKGLAEFMKKVNINLNKYTFTKETYERMVNEFGGRKLPKYKKLLEELQRSLLFAQISDDQGQLYLIEKLLIQLLGYNDITVRDQAVVFLNMLYDEVDWQLTSAFRPIVRVVGQHFKVNIVVNYDLTKDKDSQLFIGLSAPSPISDVNKSILTWHKIDKRNIVNSKGYQTEISINFGKFWKCGFYDWRIVAVKETGRLQPLEMIAKADNVAFQQIIRQQQYSPEYQMEEDDTLGSLAQGRFIVHAKNVRDQIFHEVYVDYQNAEIDTKEGRFIKRGDFTKVEKSIEQYRRRGVTALYLMGVLERDNNPIFNKAMNEYQFKKPDATPLAITARNTANNMLGGDEGFKRVVAKAKENKVKIIVDCLTRISSSRPHKKYRDLLLHYLDQDGKKHICYGTDGQSINYEDSALLNYRKIEAWDLLIEEVLQFANKHGINGINLDNGQAWPQINEPDLEELMRLEVDGTPAYSPMDILNGEIVIRNEKCGYWDTNTIETYPNPFFIKMAKKIWQAIPDFLIIGECWGGYKFENRQIILARSGIIPRLFKLPQHVSQIFGKKLFKDGRVQACEKETIRVLNDWWLSNKRTLLPEGSILLQSSSAHQWPYPAYLYGQGSWAAVDILYFMPDVPITFMGEIDGEVYRIETTKVFQHEQQDRPTTTGQGLKKTNSQIMLALQNAQEDQKEEYQHTPSGSQSTLNSQQTLEVEKRGLPKVRSGSNLAALVVEQKQGVDLKYKEEKFKADINPRAGFDLSKIGSHYEHRRRLRREKMVLRYGEYIPLMAKRNDKDFEERVFSFARYSLQETAIIAINLNDFETQFYIDYSPLQNIYKQTYSPNTVVMVTDWLKPDNPAQYYFLKELLSMRQHIRLRPYTSNVVGLTICATDGDQFVVKKALMSSLERTKTKITSGQSIESEQISLIYTDILEQTPYDIVKFANVIGTLQEIFLDKLLLSFYDMLLNNQRLRNDPKLSSRLLGLCKRIVEINDKAPVISPVKAAKSVVDSNALGPIVFCTPELGRWSTVGGLGVMVDELAYGLSLLGQEVWVISPYYERNRKGDTGYLAKDPAGITYKENIAVQLNTQYILGVHEGEVQGVKVVFLHNTEVFPIPYPDAGCADTVKQLAVFGKACLEFCCTRGIIPSVCITNDWFTGLIPAYAKIGHFGATFKGTTFLHIAHNLEPTYEGRLFPSPQEGACEFIHQLPRDWLVDRNWDKVVINPSRCAIMMSDQWATVSPSYKQDLLNTSPLSPLLKQKPQPFAFPNGIPVEARIKKLNDAAPDHLTAKKLIQKKYFGYSELDDSVPLLAFVGRITTQKGVHLILDAAEHLIQKSGFKVNILVGGAANMREPYSAQCANKMWNLKNKYPSCFWADPNQFFTDGSLVNRGTDFGLMPSIFEPGGIVQHEFFVGGTPVIAFKTGGLKDSVFEFNWDSEQGNGYTFEKHSCEDFIFACERALGTYKNKSKYLKLRQNAFDSTMDGSKVSRAWLQEFFRLRGKVFVDQDIIKETLLTMSTWAPSEYKPIKSLEELFGIERGTLSNVALEDLDFGAEEEKDISPLDTSAEKVVSLFENPKDDKFPHVFMMHNNGPRYKTVELCGTFDNWQTRHQMSFDNFTNQWFITLHLSRGKYHYKYVVDGKNWVVNEKEPREKDNQGNINNMLNL